MSDDVKSPRQLRAEEEWNARQQIKARFVSIGPAIAQQLRAKDAGSQWEVEEVSDLRDRIRFINRDRSAQPERFSITLDEFDRKVSVYGNYGQRIDGQQWIPRDSARCRELPDSPNPRMSADKDPGQLAADLVRRFLPDYRTLHAEYRRQYAQSVLHKAGRRQLAEELCALAARNLQPWGSAWEAKDPNSLQAIVRGLEGISGEVEVSSADRVNVTLSLGPEQARALLGWLGLQPQTPAADDTE